jgi:ATP-dependent exoDNAse (exonuclease V) alpha subunit
MIDIKLMKSLLDALDYKTKTRIIFVSDVDQLPSAGPRNVLSDN